MSFTATVYGDDGTSARSTVTIKAPAAGLQALGFWLAYEKDVSLASVPWNALTQVSLFTLQTTAGSALDTAGQGVNLINVPAWVQAVQSHGCLALITIGGIADQHWDTATSPANRAAFVQNLVSYMQLNGFDGIDIDIEQDNWGAQNPPVAAWTAAVQAIAQAAHAVKTKAGRVPLVSVDIDQTWMDSYLAPFAQYVDQVNLMGYASNASASLMAAQVADLASTGKTAAPKLLMGMDLDAGDAGATVTATQAAAIARFAQSAKLGGVMAWTVQGDSHNGAFPCLNAMAPYVASAPMPLPPPPVVTSNQQEGKWRASTSS